MDVKKILIVDDDPDFLDIISIKLEKEGYKIEKFDLPEKAIEKILEFNPDLVILDILMPRKDGIDIALEIKSNDKLKNKKFIFLTNYGEDYLPLDIAQKIDEKFAEEVGALLFIRKDEPLSEIVEKINNCLKY
jgi:two-component system, OmpR family, alkaline phosphatase synthesis response regulator PhoP